ncbi:MAG: hypothetical protein GQ527_03790, partial [Bacteroidales bacterium]|nr:hypothetical protein [Bacteroidales bacterium]
MKKHFFIFLMLTLSFSVSSQSAGAKSNSQKHRIIETTIDHDNNLSKKHVLEILPPTNLYVDDLGFATWDAPDIIVELPLWLQYDDGVNIQNVGVIGGGTFDAAVKWDPFQLSGFDGTFITKIKFFAGNYPNAVFTIRVYQGDDGDIIYEQPLPTVNYGNWNTIVLDSPVEIDNSQSIWVGYNVTHYSGEYPAGAGAMVENPNSDLIKIGNGLWGHLQTSLLNSWNLAAFVEGDNGKQVQLPDATYHNETPLANKCYNNIAISSTNIEVIDPDYIASQLLGFKVFLDGEFVTETENLFWQYEGLEGDESYISAVIATYDDGDSDMIEYEFSPFLPPTNLSVSPLGTATWDMPAFSGKGIFLSEGFNSGIPPNWEIENGGSTDDTWEWTEEFLGGSFDGTPFMMVNSDLAGNGTTMDEYLTSPELDVSSAFKLMISWDQNYQDIDTDDDYIAMEVFDGTDWIEVFNQVEDDPPWGNFDEKSIDVTAFKNENFRFRYHYFAPGWDWYTFIDNVKVYDGAVDYFKLYLDGNLVGTTQEMDWQFSALVSGESYTAGVSASYNEIESEIIESDFTVNSTLVPPDNLYVDEYGMAIWEAPTSSSGWLYYDNGENDVEIGGPDSFTWAIKFNPEQLQYYQDFAITKFKLFSKNNYPLTFMLMQGANAETVIYTEEFSNLGSDIWVEIELSEAVLFDIEDALWIGVHTDIGGLHPAWGGPGMGISNADLISLDGVLWEHMTDYDYNLSWNLRAFVTDSYGKTYSMTNEYTPNDGVINNDSDSFTGIKTIEKEKKENDGIVDIETNDFLIVKGELIGYNIYLDNGFVGNTNETEWLYNGLISGNNYLASVSAVYDDGESSKIEYEFTFNTSLYLDVSPSIQYVNSSSGETSFEITSNIAWDVSTSESWLDLSVIEGENDGTLIVSYTENTSGDRQGKIYINGSGVETVEVSISQEGIINLPPPQNVYSNSYGLVSWEMPEASAYELLAYVVYLDNNALNNTEETNYQLVGLVQNQTYTVGIAAAYDEGLS